MPILSFLRPLLIICFVIISGCKKKETNKSSVDPLLTLKNLYTIYQNGEISECQFSGELVYLAALNAYDGGSWIYDKNGQQIGRCNYAWGQIDSICGKLQDCEVVYRVESNIWSLPPVNKYGLGK